MPDRRWAVGTARAVTVAVGVLVVWEILFRIGVLDNLSFPSALDAVGALGSALGTSLFWHQTLTTLAAWALGLLIGGGIGVAVGVLTGLSDFAHRSLTLVVEFLKTIPVVAALPLVILMFGATLTMDVVLVALGVTWPVLIQAAYGVRAVEPVVRDTAAVFGLSRRDRLLHVVLPSAAPYIATGFRLASTSALLLVVVAQLIGGGGGLGYQIFVAQNANLLPQMYALVIVVGLLGVLIAAVFGLLERHALRWHESHRSVVV
jgi:ABC-type nitrate/sulfonate/bicarbonate transport system permease component